MMTRLYQCHHYIRYLTQMNNALVFENYYNNAEVNSILIMELDGTVLDVNRAFTKNFGYTNEAIQGQNFNILFNEQDREKRKPELELETVTATGQATDENFVINDKGLAIWAMGESLLVADIEGQQYIVKDIVNLQSKKQLQLFLLETEELLERIFESSNDIPMMVLNGSMKLMKVNNAFLSLFGLPEAPPPGSRLADLPHSFWQGAEIKKAVSEVIIHDQPFKQREFKIDTGAGEMKTLAFNSRVIEGKAGMERKVFLLIEGITPNKS
jgi:PAS domain S-box-containing protein